MSLKLVSKRITLFHFRNFNIDLCVYQAPAPVSAFDSGSNDRYYSRPCRPHRIDFWGRERTDLTPREIADYTEGWETEEDRKDWGMAA